MVGAPPDGVTVSVRFVDAFGAPVPVPLTVTAYVPGVAFAAAVNVSVLVVPAADAGLNCAVTFAGSVPVVSATEPVNEPSREIVTVLLPVAPCTTDAFVAASEKPAATDAVTARVPIDKIALHFHDTRGTALANVLTALDHGITTFDASAGGLGGCPYAPGATGNLATEDLVYMLDGLGIETGVSLDAAVQASAYMEPRVGHRLPSRYFRAVAR